MAKIIRLTQEDIEKCINDIREQLSQHKLADGKFEFQKNFGDTKERIKINFTPDAYAKMIAIIHEFDDEVAWHGLVASLPDGYVIYDILVYPQEVSGVTVNTDQAEYEKWLMNHEDSVFDNIRMQGHSHVNMGVTPSATDIEHQKKILDQLDDGMFYIFMVWNKKFECNVKIYDLERNILFESKDVDVGLLDADKSLSGFLDEAKKMVKRKPIHTKGTRREHMCRPTPEDTQEDTARKNETKKNKKSASEELEDEWERFSTYGYGR
jgi:hypothetical protein